MSWPIARPDGRRRGTRFSSGIAGLFGFMGSRLLFPATPIPNAIDCRQVDTKLSRDDMLLIPARANRAHLFVGEFCGGRSRAARGAVATFPMHIGDVVELRPEPEMIRPDTQGHITPMEHAHARRDRSVMETVAFAMGGKRFPLATELSITGV